jgi:adenylylsulfate reductase subunit B
MPTFVYMTRCDGCGHCVDICPSDIMHIDKVTPCVQHRAEHVLGVLLLREGMPAQRHRRPRLCRLRATGPLGSSDSRRGEGRHRLADQVPQRQEGHEPARADHDQALGQAHPATRRCAGAEQGQRDSQLLFNEPKYIRFDDGDMHTLKSNGLKLIEGVEGY